MVIPTGAIVRRKAQPRNNSGAQSYSSVVIPIGATLRRTAQPRNNSGAQSDDSEAQDELNKPTTGSRTIGSVNWNNVAALQNFLGTTGQRGADYLRSLGIMPTYNGQPLDEAMYGAPQRQWTSGSSPLFGNSKYRRAAGLDVPAGTRAVGLLPGMGMASSERAAQRTGLPYYWDAQRNAFITGASGPSGAVAGGMGVGAPAGGTQDPIGAAYLRLIGQGGLPFSASDQARMINLSSGPIARGTQDAIRQAREDAVRRGDTSGSTLGDIEARIRQRGAADIGRARFEAETGLRQQALQNLMALLGGAGGYATEQQKLQLLLGQLEGQNPAFGQGLGLMMEA